MTDQTDSGSQNRPGVDRPYKGPGEWHAQARQQPPSDAWKILEGEEPETQ